LIYRYYASSRWESLPYFSTLMAFAALVYLHLLLILVALHRLGWYRLNVNYSLEQCRNAALLLLLPVFVIPAILVKKKDLQEAPYDEYDYYKLKRGGWMLALYIIFSVVLLMKLLIG